MSRDWNDLQYGKLPNNEHKMEIGNAGAWYDDSSNTIRWHYKDTFVIQFLICEIAKDVQKQPYIYAEPESDVVDFYRDYYFDFELYRLTGEQQMPCYSLKNVRMNLDKGIDIVINDEISSMLTPGIYSYSLIAHTPDNDTNSVKTLIGRDNGRIQVQV